MKKAEPLTPEQLARMSTDPKAAPNIRAWAKALLAKRQPPEIQAPAPASDPQAPAPAVEPPKELQDPWRLLNEVPALGRCHDCRYPFQVRRERLPFHKDEARAEIVQICQSCAVLRWKRLHLTVSP